MMSKLETISDIGSYLEKRGESLKSLDVEQIKSIEDKYGISLPDVYKQFLKLMGNGAANYMRGSSVFYNELFFLQQWAVELISENALESLPDDAFVFWMHQGYQAAYFRLSEGQDPPIYLFSEGGKYKKGFELKEGSLTDFFLTQLRISYPDIIE